MRYMNRVIHIRSMDIGRFRHNFEGFCRNFTYPVSLNEERMTPSKRAHVNLVESSPLSSLYLSMQSIEEEIQSYSNYVDTCRS